MVNWKLDPWQVVGTAAVFMLCISVWTIGVIIWAVIQSRRQERLRERLGLNRMPGDKPVRELFLWTGGRVIGTAVPSVARIGLGERLRLLHESAGWENPPAVFLGVAGGVICATFLAAYAWSASPSIGLIAVFCAGAFLVIYINGRIAKRNDLFERQLLDALGLATRSLRAGHPLIGAFQLIASEMKPPISRIFGEICQSQELGLRLDEAIARSAQRSTNADFRLFATAVVIQLRSGGNLAEMMDRLTTVIRERLRLIRRGRILTSQVQLSKRILLVLPVLIYLILTLLNPGYESRLIETHAGRVMLGLAVLNMVVGAWVMNRIAVLRY